MATERADESEAGDRKRRLGQYAVVWRDGRPVRLEPGAQGSADGSEVDLDALTSPGREPGRAGGDNEENRK